MEGYFWRITDPQTEPLIIALIGVNRGPHGPWATLGFAGQVVRLRNPVISPVRAEVADERWMLRGRNRPSGVADGGLTTREATICDPANGC